MPQKKMPYDGVAALRYYLGLSRKEKEVAKLNSIVLNFEREKGEDLVVSVDGEGIIFSRGSDLIGITKSEAQVIQRFLQDACSTVWRSETIGVEGAMREARVPGPTVQGGSCDEAQRSEP